MTWKHHMQ